MPVRLVNLPLAKAPINWRHSAPHRNKNLWRPSPIIVTMIKGVSQGFSCFGSQGCAGEENFK